MFKSRDIFEILMILSFICIRGLLFFKQSLYYSPQDIGQRFHFIVDKDFSYLEVIIWIQCINSIRGTIAYFLNIYIFWEVPALARLKLYNPASRQLAKQPE